MNKKQIAEKILGTRGGQYSDQVELAFSDVEMQKERTYARLRAELDKATFTDDCLDVYDNSISDFEQMLAFMKAVSVAITVEELRRCFQRTESHSREAYMCIRAIAAILEKEGKD